ncbi:MAG: hypothetical protein RLZZ238_1104 [Planctomycetota bacterium]
MSTTAAPTEAAPNPEAKPALASLNPDTNGGRWSVAEPAPGLEFVFTYPGTGTDEATGRAASGSNTRLFGDPTLAADDENGGFSIRESSDSGSVGFLLATNKTAHDVLLIAGQLVKGGKQNRGINADMLVAAGRSAPIPVTCVEQGRWRGAPRSRFSHGGVEPTFLRMMKMRQVHQSRRQSGEASANQSAVWSGIDTFARSMAVPSGSGDLLSSAAQLKSRGFRSTPASSRSVHTPQPRRGRLLTWMDGVAGPPVELPMRDMGLQQLERYRRIAESLLLDRGISEASMRDSFDELRELLGQAEREYAERIRDRNATEGRGPGSDPEPKPQPKPEPERTAPPASPDFTVADERAVGANGMLVFLNGEFLAGDIFANPEWFRTVYGDLRDSASLTWAYTATRSNANKGSNEDSLKDSHKSANKDSQAEGGSDSIQRARALVGDAFAGSWAARKPLAHGHSYLLEHDSYEGAVLSDTGNESLHVLIGTKSLPASMGGR